ncbi:type II secretion system ATPase GspE [Geomesophilobacter sediminis]|uniref:protein-secreting ATPase n=1 Tax=Geomesophilobacter sediminis TaxID=2798584 RepID=A0A8J7M133_9BACT|nr:type II secretion system ATPase GspE [Geomesophilobacter sediminis]MBJ6726628.1 type II secretion system ATPase GspE [Geomesophilobacter sediminis]
MTDISLETIAERLGIPFMGEIDDSRVDTALVGRIPLAFARNNALLPMRDEEGRIVAACADPANLLAIDELAGLFGQPVDLIAVPRPIVLEAVNRIYSRLSGSAQEVVEELEGEELSDVATSFNEPRDLMELTDEAPVIRLLNSILFQAVKERASDIHIEPFERELEVRFRIDGLLYKMLSPPKLVQEALTSRVKIMSGLNIAEKRLPQDGRFKVKVAGRDVDIRVSLIPTFFGERVVLRLLDKQRGILTLREIGLSEGNDKMMERLLSRTSGIILVTGPTGSGKSTTLYAAISQINSPEKNIITIEDPIEYQLKGVGQIQVNPKIELTFANGLRSILRQDPDVVMVGEIRDAETAEIAMQAALTGHLVLSTLHTNDAATAVSRLIDMGIEPFMVASSLSAVLAQRLVRVICPHCKEEYRPDRDYPGVTLPPVLYRGRGCEKCFNLGTTGRIGIYELLPIDPEICSMIIRKTPSGVIKEYAISKGMRTLREDGLAKAAAGITSIEEVLRVTQEDYADLSL